jgi:hypothetical protein
MKILTCTNTCKRSLFDAVLWNDHLTWYVSSVYFTCTSVLGILHVRPSWVSYMYVPPGYLKCVNYWKYQLLIYRTYTAAPNVGFCMNMNARDCVGIRRNNLVATFGATDPFVVSTSQSFPHSGLITGFVARLTRQVTLVEPHELLILSEHLSSSRLLVGFVLVTHIFHIHWGQITVKCTYVCSESILLRKVWVYHRSNLNPQPQELLTLSEHLSSPRLLVGFVLLDL